MKIQVQRLYKKDTYTIGKMFIDGKYFCDTLEDKDRGLNSSMSESQIKGVKVYGETAIPMGTYKIDMNTISPKFSKYPFYQEVCKGKIPRLIGVKGFNGILIDVADRYNGASLVQGCIGIGKNKIKGGLLEGKETFKKLYSILSSCNNDQIEIEII